MGLFQEYMDARGKVKKPITCIVGGRPTPETPPNKPPKEHGNAPYIAKGEKDSKKGFGDMGDTKIDPTKESAPAKIPVAEQAELCSLVTDTIKRDNSLIEQLVFQLRNKKLLGPMIGEMLNYKETFQHLSEVMAHESHGPKVCSKLARAMNEEVAPPMSASLEGQDIEDSPDESEEGDDFENEDVGLDDMDMDMDVSMEDDELGLDDEEMMHPEQESDPLMMDDPQMQAMGQAPMAPPKQPSAAMMNFMRAMMNKG